eukprot:2211349-Lingulodinium_polyedra.AAC.1
MVSSHKWYFFQGVWKCYACAYGYQQGSKLRACSGAPKVVAELLEDDRGHDIMVLIDSEDV